METEKINLPQLYYRQGQLLFDGHSVAGLGAEFGTPLFVYSARQIEQQVASYRQGAGGLPLQIMYSVKANSNLAILRLLKQQGCGFDIVSGAELQRVLAIGAQPQSIVFSGVGKTAGEMQMALEVGIKCFNVESLNELALLDKVAGQLKLKAPVSLRINPDVDAKTHPYISTGLKNNKFGIAHEQCLAAYAAAAELEHIDIVGIDCHIGSQITTLEPYLAAVDKILALVEQLATQQIRLRHIDFGGGLAIIYDKEQIVAADKLVAAITARVRQLTKQPYQLLVEPGRSIIGNAGICITQALYTKKQTNGKNFLIVDAAMNDLPRPALYQAYHHILPAAISPTVQAVNYDVVGPVCESADCLGSERSLAVEQGDYLAVASAGAYCMSMASNYNSRARAAEVLIEHNAVKLIRRRENFADLIQTEIY